MIEQSLLNYLNEFILKSGEELEWISRNTDNALMDVKIIKRSKRTYRIIGLLTIASETATIEDILDDPELEALALTARKKVYLDDQNRKTFYWLERGWIMKEVRFEKDEKTVKSSHYRMGFRLYQDEQLKLQEKEEQLKNEFTLLKKEIVANVFTQRNHLSGAMETRMLALREIGTKLNKLDGNEVDQSLYFPQKWALRKRLKFLHFVNAFSQLCLRTNEFDWKEIGAAYYQKIGGSKEFDAFKEEFMEQLEEWTDMRIDEFGLTSLGQIVPVFFSGQLRGRHATFGWDSIHAVTNISIAEEFYQTDATKLWLVENRAVLTRMAATEHFLHDTKSLVICVDGHLRLTHRSAISQILNNSKLEQVLIWCDYDPDGLQISKEIYTEVKQHPTTTVKWVLPEQQITRDWNRYEEQVLRFLESDKMEQEQMMGGETQWRKWIRD